MRISEALRVKKHSTMISEDFFKFRPDLSERKFITAFLRRAPASMEIAHT